MPTLLYSPPPRSSRWPSHSRTVDTPPLPSWTTPTTSSSTRYRHWGVQAPKSKSSPPIPSRASSAMKLQNLPTSSPSISRSSSSSSSSSSASSLSPRITTPPPKPPSRSSSRLLPVLPLSVDTSLQPKGRRVVVDYTEVPDEGVHIVISRDVSQSPSPRRVNGIPPRLRRSPIRQTDPSRNSTLDLLPPQPTYARSASPSGSSISTISDAATTPRASAQSDRSDPTIPSSSHPLVSVSEDPPASAPCRKRDSTQRRLSALRGLVVDLDFNQPWSLSEKPVQEEQASFFWACGGPEEMLSEPISPPMALVHDVSPERSRVRRNASATALAMPPSTPDPASPSDSFYTRIDMTPVGREPIRKPNSTPLRRPRQFRSSSDLLSRTPDPPRAQSRQRREVFDVASSGYSKCLEPTSPLPHTSSSTSFWRSSLSSDDIFHRVLQQQGPAEIKRQEIMWEMCETEQAFVKSMRTVLRLFATPLKTPQGKWIQGIPERITDLFDSLKCVAQAHGIIYEGQRDMRRRSDLLDIRSFVTLFKDWVPRLAVHESYLLRFETVVQLVEDNVRDPHSVFGEFVRMQMKEEVLGSMSLGSMLLKPVQRLTKYPLFLRRLLDVTPYPHPCHPEILSLLSTTESIILNLQAMKAREEDFDQLRSLESRLCGLPEGFTLATRGRKLIGRSPVIRVPPQKESSPSFSRGRGSLHSSCGSISSTMSSSSPWDFYRAPTPSTCRTSAFSVSSSASSSYCPPSQSNSIVQTSPQRPGVSRSPSSASSESRPPTPSSLRGFKRKEEVLTMLIFNDLVIVAGESEKVGLFTGKKKEKTWRVLPEMDGGVGKVAEVRDWSGYQGHSSLFTVTALPIGHSPHHPLGPISTAFTLAPSRDNHKENETKGSKSGLLANCPQLSSLQQLLSVLAQTTFLLGEGCGGGEDAGEGKEMLRQTGEGL